MSKQEKDKEVIVCAVADINHEVCLARGQQQGEDEEEVKADLVKRYHSSGLDAIKDSVYIPDFFLLLERATSSEANSFSPQKCCFPFFPLSAAEVISEPRSGHHLLLLARIEK